MMKFISVIILFMCIKFILAKKRLRISSLVLSGVLLANRKEILGIDYYALWLIIAGVFLTEMLCNKPIFVSIFYLLELT